MTDRHLDFVTEGAIWLLLVASAPFHLAIVISTAAACAARRSFAPKANAPAVAERTMNSRLECSLIR